VTSELASVDDLRGTMDCIRSIGAATYTMGGGRTVPSAARTNGGWPINGLRGRHHHEPQQVWEVLV